MRIQLRLNEVGLGRMSVMIRSSGKVSDASDAHRVDAAND